MFVRVYIYNISISVCLTINNPVGSNTKHALMHSYSYSYS